MQSTNMHTRTPHRSARRSTLSRLPAFLLGTALALLVACSSTPKGPLVTIHTSSGDAEVVVELALTRDSQARGLMWRTELPEGTGMLFVFPEEAERSFWMSNTPIPLDILYIRGDGSVVSIASRTTPYSEASIPSRGACRYVLEVPGGWSEKHGIRPGDKVTLPNLDTAADPAA